MAKKITSKQQFNELGKFAYTHIKAEIIGVVCVVLVVEVLFFGNIVYGAKWVTCGRQPVVLVDTTPFVSFGAPIRTATIITHPGFFEEKHSIIPDGRKLFCTLDEATKQARHDTLSSPDNSIVIK